MTASVRDPDATDPGAHVDPRRARAATWGVVVVVLGTGAYLLVGPHGPLWLLLLLLAAGYAGFAALVWGGRNEGALSRRAVLVATAVLFLLALANPPIESGDVWSYAMYGRMVSTYHDNPYTHVPSDYPTDPVARRVTRIWKSTPSVYGPVFVATAAPGMWLVGTSALGRRLYFQLLALLSVAAAMWLVYRWTGGSALRSRWWASTPSWWSASSTARTTTRRWASWSWRGSCSPSAGTCAGPRWSLRPPWPSRSRRCCASSGWRCGCGASGGWRAAVETASAACSSPPASTCSAGAPSRSSPFSTPARRSAGDPSGTWPAAASPT